MRQHRADMDEERGEDQEQRGDAPPKQKEEEDWTRPGLQLPTMSCRNDLWLPYALCVTRQEADRWDDCVTTTWNRLWQLFRIVSTNNRTLPLPSLLLQHQHQQHQHQQHHAILFASASACICNKLLFTDRPSNVRKDARQWEFSCPFEHTLFLMRSALTSTVESREETRHTACICNGYTYASFCR